jgi:hypothetical protein
MTRVAAPGVCKVTGSAQKPPTKENCLLVIGPWASAWPTVPLSENALSLTRPPPQATLNQPTE